MKNDKSFFRNEWKRAFLTYGFGLVLFISLLLAGVQGIECFLIFLGNPDSSMFQSVFTVWLPADGRSWTQWAYYFFIPVLAALPYGMSVLDDRKSGYIKNVLQRMKKSRYFRVKGTVAFCSGGIAAVLPMACSFLFHSLYVPIRTVDVLTHSGGIAPFAFASQLFYSNTAIYMLIFFALTFLFGGGMSLMANAIALFTDFRFTVLLGPFLITLVFYNICNILDLGNLAPFSCLQPLQPMKFSLVAILTEIGVVLAVSRFLLMKKGCSEDVF